MSKQHLMIPTWYELAMLFSGSLLSLVALNLIPILNNKDPDTYKFLAESISDRVGRILNLFTGSRWTSILTIVLWMLVGALVYILGWVLVSVFQSYQKDVTPRNFILPFGYKTSKNINDIIARFLIRTLAVVGVIAWVGIFFGYILPVSSDLFVRAFSHVKVSSVLFALSSFGIMMCGFYMFSILLRLIYLRRRIFG